jgi:hypothetical protein
MDEDGPAYGERHRGEYFRAIDETVSQVYDD